ncbi:MAG: helix-turn-helix transcriptional regulator [Clostridia bacterium]|nr:helix-turn-helix transcriptional regulator [Clostridia bacterium]
MARETFKDIRMNDWKNIPKSFFYAEKIRADYINDFDMPFHYHPYYELYYLLEGSCVHLIGKNKYILKPGDWILIPCDAEHRVYYNTSPHERILFRFTRNYIPYSLLDKMYLFNLNPMYVANDNTRENIDNIMFRILSEYKNSDEYSDEIYKNLLFELLVYFIRKSSDGDIIKITDLITEHAIDYINVNYAENITLEKLADLNDVSPGYMSRKFKSDTGVNISEYIRKVRIKQAKILLLETNDSISQISEKCGFTDSNYFSYIFKQEENISPLRYRKAYSQT